MTEFALIDSFVKVFRPAASPRGPGDDCAVLPPSRLSSCVTTDAIVEGVHFSRSTFSSEDIGHKALAVNLSDLASMGATPSWFLCALGLPPTFSAREVQRVARGMAALAKRSGIELIGGNVTKSPALTITITASGSAKRPILRSGARPGELLFVTGPLGDAAGGLDALRAGKAKECPQLVLAQRRPEPKLAYAPLLQRFATSAIDLSDGLVQDLGHVAQASGVALHVQSSALPISEALRTSFLPIRQPLRHALTGGEDYALAFTCAPTKRAGLLAAARTRGLSLHEIGAVKAGQGVWLDGARWRGKAGFQHR